MGRFAPSNELTVGLFSIYSSQRTETVYSCVNKLQQLIRLSVFFEQYDLKVKTIAQTYYICHCFQRDIFDRLPPTVIYLIRLVLLS